MKTKWKKDKCGKDYCVLDVGKDASDNGNKKEFMKLSIKFHPDKQIGKSATDLQVK